MFPFFPGQSTQKETNISELGHTQSLDNRLNCTTKEVVYNMLEEEGRERGGKRRGIMKVICRRGGGESKERRERGECTMISVINEMMFSFTMKSPSKSEVYRCM